jgi:arginase
MAPTIVIFGVPTALGGHLSGMELAPHGLRQLGLVDRLQARPGLAGISIADAGDLIIDPGFRSDADPRAKNRALIREFLPREAARVTELMQDDAGDGRQLLILGGDCTAHVGAMAGLRRQGPARRLAIAWFDAHGDFNTPDSTPSGNVWGMPFAMIAGRGDKELVAAAAGPTVADEDAALFGGQVLDELESRALAASAIAHFGAGMLATEAGTAAVRAWAEMVARRVDGLYIAIDMDCLNGPDGWAVTMPEPDGITLETAVGIVRILAGAMLVLGFGATGITLGNGNAAQTADAVAALAEAAFAA